VGGEGGGGELELLAEFADREAVGAGLDEGAEGGEAGLVTESVEGGERGFGIHDSIIPEKWN
jgi:hypothetical protein